MALNVQTVTVKTLSTGDLTRDVIVVDGTGDSAEVLIKTGMPADALKMLTTIDANGVGTTLKDKMQSYVLPNGKTAWAAFGGSVKTMASFKSSYSSVYTKTGCASKVAAFNTAIQNAKTSLTAIAGAANLAAAQTSATAALAALATVA
jgi:hypothetical protein